MTNRRSALLPFLLAAAGLLAMVPAGRVQAQLSPRFAFADTTLLRDTLGLRFDRLFETADSLGLLPDSLRAHIIRYRLSMSRLVFMADSMRVPVDSVGVTIARERFNLFAGGAAAQSRTSFRYSTGYDIARTSTIWTNSSDYSLVRGKLLISNVTNVDMHRSTAGGRVSLRQERTSNTRADWRMRQGISAGGRVLLGGWGEGGRGEDNSKFELTASTRQKYTPDLSSDLNLSSGLLNVKNDAQVKRGVTGDVNGGTRFLRGNWFSHDLRGAINGNLSRTRVPTSDVTLATRDLSGNLRGALLLYQQAPVSLNANYSANRSQVESPTEQETVNRFVTSRASSDAAVRFRVSNDRYLTVTGNAGRNVTLTGTKVDHGVQAIGRWTQGQWALDTKFSNLIGDSRYPRRAGQFGYKDRQDNRQATADLTRPLSRRLTAKLSGSISLVQSRSQAIADSANPPTPRDSYRQSYRAQASYNPSERANSTVTLEVGLARSINLPAASTSNNTDTRTYRAIWSWNYRLLRLLTASQTNTVSADYQFYPFAPERNGLSLDYRSSTQLNAVLTPRLKVDLSHNAGQQPRGEWRVLPDGSGVLLPSDENLSYTLRAGVTWTPSQLVSFTLAPTYQATDRSGTLNGVEAPTRRTRKLDLDGGTNLNIPIGPHGQLSGTVTRRFSSDRSTTFVNGQPLASPVAEQDFWSGRLEFSWEL